jgi:hypothetical protein
LIWKLARALGSENLDSFEFTEPLLVSYEDERRPVARLNATISVQNFEKTLAIPRAIGLNWKSANLLCCWLDRIPAPQALKRICFHTAMRLGLKQIDWLKANNFIGRHRRQALRKIFKNAKLKTLQLLFPGQDLGFAYKQGWLAGRNKSGADPFDPFTFEPAFKLGGRIPHFWLVDRDGRKFSVLDLPLLMMGKDDMPCYVMLIAGKADQTPEAYDVTQNRKFQPVIIAEIMQQSELKSKTHFSFPHNRPSFLPPYFAVLTRPDGHIAWLHPTQ